MSVEIDGIIIVVVIFFRADSTVLSMSMHEKAAEFFDSDHRNWIIDQQRKTLLDLRRWKKREQNKESACRRTIRKLDSISQSDRNILFSFLSAKLSLALRRLLVLTSSIRQTKSFGVVHCFLELNKHSSSERSYVLPACVCFPSSRTDTQQFSWEENFSKERSNLAFSFDHLLMFRQDS